MPLSTEFNTLFARAVMSNKALPREHVLLSLCNIREMGRRWAMFPTSQPEAPSLWQDRRSPVRLSFSTQQGWDPWKHLASAFSNHIPTVQRVLEPGQAGCFLANSSLLFLASIPHDCFIFWACPYFQSLITKSCYIRIEWLRLPPSSSQTVFLHYQVQ